MKSQLLLYNDGAIRIENRSYDSPMMPNMIEEAVYVPLSSRVVSAVETESPSFESPSFDIITRTFVRRAETRRYVIYEEVS